VPCWNRTALAWKVGSLGLPARRIPAAGGQAVAVAMSPARSGPSHDPIRADGWRRAGKQADDGNWGARLPWLL
jgi:hypothetical protein